MEVIQWSPDALAQMQQNNGFPRGLATIAPESLTLPGTPGLSHLCSGAQWGHYSRKSPKGTLLDTNPPLTQASLPAPFPRERSICFPCLPDLWATLFFICLHKLSRVTCFFPEGGMLSAPQGHRSVDLPKEEGVTGGHLGTGCRYRSCLAPRRFLGTREGRAEW